MSVPRLMLCGLEPGPAAAFAGGALLAAFEGDRVVRPVSVGLDLPLWRLLEASPGESPRAFDLVLHDDETALELYGAWTAGCELMLLIAVEPALDRWCGVAGSRPVDIAAGLDVPVILVVDARDRGPTVAAAAYGVRALARRADLAGAIIIGGEERGAGAETARLLREAVGVPVLGAVPPRLSEQFVHHYGAGAGHVRQIRPRPVEGGELRLCAEAATYLRRGEIEAVAARRGFLPASPRKVLSPAPAAAGLTLAVAWGPPLTPLALENIDLLRALGLRLVPLNIARDRALPPGTSGLLLAGQLDEDRLGAFAANRALLAALAAAVDDGLPTLALGGGALLLLRRLADGRGRSHELAGVFPAEAELLEWYERPRYVRVRATRENPYADGDDLVYETFSLEYLLLEQESFAYQVLAADAGGEASCRDADDDREAGVAAAGAPAEPAQAEGFVRGRCMATTLYPSLPRRPGLATAFVDHMRQAAPRP